MARAKYPIELLSKDDFTVNGVLRLEIEIPKNLEPALNMLGIGKEERENLVSQKLSEIAQLLGYDPDGTFG